VKRNRLLTAGITAGLALSALAFGSSPAGATVHVGAINCDAHAVLLPSTDIGHVSVQNPSEAHVQGPIWTAQGSSFSFVTPASISILPVTAGGQTVSKFQDINNTSQIIGVNAPPTTGGSGAGDTTVTTVPAGTAIPGYFWDNNVSDATPPVPMNGAGGNPPAPTAEVTAGPGLLAAGGVWYAKVSIAPNSYAPGLVPAGPIGGAIYAPAQSVAVSNAGSIDGPINYIGASTSLTAFVLGGAISATTTCAPSATPEHVTHIHTAGSPANKTEPVLSCKPTPGTTGTNVISKGLWSGPAGNGDPAFTAVGSSLKTAVTYDGCVVPDQQAQQWVLSKHGALAADALAASKAILSLKAKGFADCTGVSIRNGAGQSENGAVNSYEMVGSIGTKFTNASNVVVKVPGTKASVTIKLIIDQNTSLANPLTIIPEVSLEADGVATKGMGAGGNVKFVGELDPANAAVLAMEGCNGVGPVGAPNVYIGAAGLPIKTAGDAVFQVDRP
jgi:hypothetical protein